MSQWKVKSNGSYSQHSWRPYEELNTHLFGRLLIRAVLRKEVKETYELGIPLLGLGLELGIGIRFRFRVRVSVRVW